MSRASEYRVVIADDHPAFLAGVRQYFRTRSDFPDIFEASDGKSCLELILHHDPDWAVIDLAMPKMTGFDVLKELTASSNATRMVVMSMHAEQAYADRARELGAIGFIAKEDALSELDEALETSDSEFFTSNSVGRAAADFLEERSKYLFEMLTPQEEKILQFLAQGLTSREIANQFNISTRTVQAHRRNMSEKLNLRGPNRLMEFAMKHSGKI